MMDKQKGDWIFECNICGKVLETDQADIYPERQDEWLKAERVFNKGQALFERFGGMNHDRAVWDDEYPYLVQR